MDLIAIHDSTEDVQLRSYDLDGMHSILCDSDDLSTPFPFSFIAPFTSSDQFHFDVSPSWLFSASRLSTF